MRKEEILLIYLQSDVLKSMLFIERSTFERNLRAREWAERKMIQMNQEQKDALWKKIIKEAQ
jgi:hypothetical protein